MRIVSKTTLEKIKKFLKTHSIIFCLSIIICFMKAFHIGCLIKALIGIPCPGCGLTRATLAFFRFDLKNAFHYHPLFWLATPFLILCIYGKKPLFNSKKAEISVYAIVGTLFIAVYIYRMATLFPNNEPMNINRNSILEVNLKIIKSFLFKISW